jgi:streptomycin 6-kinase
MPDRTRVQLPPGLESRRSLGADWGRWLDRLPTRTGELLEEWELRPSAEPLHGFASLVQPVVTGDGERGALKVTFDGDDESEHEGLALQRWGGRGAVRLLRADPRRRALLLEWADGPDLSDAWDVEACEVVGGLYGDLHVPAAPQLRTVTSYVDRWLDDLVALGRDVPVPRRYVEQAVALGRDLVSDPASTGVIVHGDLHYENVLGAERIPWVVIDPKAMSGDPHYEPAPMLWNRMDELGGPGAAESLRDGLRRRFHTLVDVAGLDQDRARDWVVVRMVVNAGWSVGDARREGRALTADEQDWITRCIAVTKAVQD